MSEIFKLKALNGPYAFDEKCITFLINCFNEASSESSTPQTKITIPLRNVQPEMKITSSPITLTRTESGKGFWVSGQTYPHRTQFKALGGSWNKFKQAWIFNNSDQEAVLAYLPGSLLIGETPKS
jgi:hypothetical protein